MRVKSRRPRPGGGRRHHPTGGAVGYGKPPRAHQFKPGKSGNPKGRPKGRKNESTILQDLLHQKIEVREAGGRVRKVSLLEAIHLRIAEDSLKGNTKSATFLLNRYGALVTGETTHTSMNEDDEAILRDFLQQQNANGG